MKNHTKEKLARGETVLGIFSKMSDPALVEQSALAGFDFIIIDMEHGPATFETAQDLIRAAELRNMTPIIRTSDASHVNLLRSLDIGAHGVQVPQVSTREIAEDVVRGAKFAPAGARGVCRYTRAAEYTNIEKTAHFARSNAETLVIVHIEGIEGINNLDQILAVKGIDVIFLGPYDLSQSCGVPGQTGHPLVVEKMQQAVHKATAAGVMVGTFVESAEMARFWHQAGVRYISYSVDAGIYFTACRQIVEKTREALSLPASPEPHRS